MNEKRWRHKENPASLGTIKHRGLGEKKTASVFICSRLFVTVPLKMPRNAACNKGLKVWDRVCYKSSSPCLGNIQSETSQSWLMYKTCAWSFGVPPWPISQTPKPTPDYQYTIKPKYWNIDFCSEEGNKGTETCQNRFFFHKNNMVD